MPFFQGLLCPTKCVGQAWDKVGTRDKRDKKAAAEAAAKSVFPNPFVVYLHLE